MIGKKKALSMCAASVILLGVSACTSNGNTQEDQTQESSTTQSVESTVVNPNRDDLDAAKEEAKRYAEDAKSSKEWTITHLYSPQGANFDENVAREAVDSIDVDWQKNADEMAKFYKEELQMDDDGIKEALVNNGMFTDEEAVKSLNNIK